MIITIITVSGFLCRFEALYGLVHKSNSTCADYNSNEVIMSTNR